MSMGLIGFFALLVAFAAAVLSVALLLVGHVLGRKKPEGMADTFSYGGCVATLLAAVAFTVACGVLVACFFIGDYSIQYVLDQHSDDASALGWLYRLAGLWAGREGSLLFWAWLIGIFNATVAVRALRRKEPLDYVALLVAQLVLAAFAGMLLFSEDNMPFTATDSQYYDEDGYLNSSGELLGMNALLEHWAMAIHPPTLFLGYAGLAVPFAYAIAALVVNDASKTWVERSTRYVLVSWVFLSCGIALGAVWAYVVLGWGGYWGWDPVENASLLPWLACAVLSHSLTAYRQRGAFRRWTVLAACIAFAFSIVGTMITRSGIVQSVHAFSSDPVSLVFFTVMLSCSLLAGIVGLVVRRKTFVPAPDAGEMEAIFSKDGAYYFNNLLLMIAALLLLYLTICSALPEWLPFGGQTISSGTYNAIARPLGLFYAAILAICPLLSWRKTGGRQFLSRAKWPGVAALVLFAVLMAYFALVLVPSYDAEVAYLNEQIADGSTTALDDLNVIQPAAYYLGLTVVGFAIASALFFNMLFMLVKALKSGVPRVRRSEQNDPVGMLRQPGQSDAAGLSRYSERSELASEVEESHGEPQGRSLDSTPFGRSAQDDDARWVATGRSESESSDPSQDVPRSDARSSKRRTPVSLVGGMVAHLGVAVLLVGLIGSSMFVTERTGYLGYDADTDSGTDSFVIGDYSLEYSSNSVVVQNNHEDIYYTVVLDVYKNGEQVGQVAPSIKLKMTTQEQNAIAGVVSLPLEDVFVVYRGVNDEDAFSLDVRVNPLISFVWVGSVLLVLGIAIGAFGRRKAKKRSEGFPTRHSERSELAAPTRHSERSELASGVEESPGEPQGRSFDSTPFRRFAQDDEAGDAAFGRSAQDDEAGDAAFRRSAQDDGSEGSCA